MPHVGRKSGILFDEILKQLGPVIARANFIRMLI